MKIDTRTCKSLRKQSLKSSALPKCVHLLRQDANIVAALTARGPRVALRTVSANAKNLAGPAAAEK
jgi:hypothetical protein